MFCFSRRPMQIWKINICWKYYPSCKAQWLKKSARIYSLNQCITSPKDAEVQQKNIIQTCPQGSSGNRDIENRFVDTARKEEGGMRGKCGTNGESSPGDQLHACNVLCNYPLTKSSLFGKIKGKKMFFWSLGPLGQWDPSLHGAFAHSSFITSVV